MSKTLRELADVEYGASPKEIRVEYSTPFKIFGTGGLVGYSRKPLFEGPLVVVARKGTLDRPVFSEDSCWVIDTAFAVIPKKNNDAKWLYYQLSNYDLKRLNEATGVPSISRDFLYRVSFEEVGPSEQRKIARILSTVDAVIEQTEQAIAKYKAIKAGMLHDLFTRGLDANGKLRAHQAVAPHLYKQSELGWIPVEWEVKRMDDVAAETILGITTRGVSNDSESIPLLKMGNLNWGYLDLTHVEQVRSTAISNEQQILIQRDFLFNTRNTPELVGKAAIWNCEFQKATFDNNLLRIRFKKGTCSPFVCYFMSFGRGRNLIKSLVDGTTSVAAVYWKNLKNYLIPLPREGEQEAIISKLHAVDETIASELSSLAKTVMLKTGLMQNLLSGRKTVQVEEPAATGVSL